MAEETNFVIVSIPRSGSNYLCGMLNSHPQILCHHELFHSSAIYYALDHRADLDLGDLSYRNADPCRFLSSVWENRFSKKCVGFKIFPEHNDDLLKNILVDVSVKKIILERPNLLRVFVSKLVAQKTGIYSSLQGPMSPPDSVHINIQELLSFIQDVETYFAQCKKILDVSGQHYLTVRYPDILDGEEMTGILRFLRAGAEARLSTPHQKQGNYLLKKLITNLDEVREFLQSSNTLHYLEDNCE